MAFRPLVSRHRLYGWLALGGAIVIALALLLWLLRTPVGPATLLLALALALCLAAAGTILYRLLALRGLDYWVDRDAVRILWDGDTLIIPLGDIQKVEKQSDRGGQKPRWRQWPAHWMQPLRPERKEASYATAPPEQCVALTTPYAVALISPADADAFIAALRERQALGPARVLKPTLAEAAHRHHWLWRESLPRWTLAAGLLAGLLLAGYIIFRYPQLPLEIPLHFDATGAADRLAARRAIFLIPAITLLIWFFNAAMGLLLYERRKLASYMLWLSALALQLAAFVIVDKLFQTFLH